MRKFFGCALDIKFWLNFNKDIFADKIWVLFLQGDKAMRILNVTSVSLFRDGWSHFTQGEWFGCTAMCHFLLSCGYACCSRNLPWNVCSNWNRSNNNVVWSNPKKRTRILGPAHSYSYHLQQQVPLVTLEIYTLGLPLDVLVIVSVMCTHLLPRIQVNKLIYCQYLDSQFLWTPDILSFGPTM